jgi:hypothetical protein
LQRLVALFPADEQEGGCEADKEEKEEAEEATAKKETRARAKAETEAKAQRRAPSTTRGTQVPHTRRTTPALRKR